MTDKVTLSNPTSFQNDTTAVAVITANNAAVTTAMNNTLSRDGTSPNTMGANLDMNNNQILNLPNPATVNSPLRLQDLNSFNHGGTIATVPAGGTTGQVLTKSSSTDYAMGWTTTGTGTVSSVGLALPADFTVTNSPVTSTGTLTGAWATTPQGTGAVVRAISPTLTTPTVNSPTITTNGGAATMTFPTVTDTLVGRATTDTLTNKTISGSNNTISNIPLSALPAQAAWTLLGNNTGSSAVPAAFTIDSLTVKGIPVAADEVLIWDVAGSAMKKATVTSIGTASGVSSLNALTGALSIAAGTGITVGAAGSNVTVNQSLANQTFFNSASNPTGTTNTTGIMMGLGSTFHITPSYSGRIHVTVQGFGQNNTASDALSVQLYIGSGTAPTNGAAATGTSMGTALSIGGGAQNANVSFPFSVSGILTGLSPGTAYWIDIRLAAVVGGTASIQGLTCTAFEF